tara:strand:+ start:48 stop:362 length:315 start_codon:yes stop_codon:yes gene_type:complete
MAGKILIEYTDDGVKRMFCDIILQAIREYRKLKDRGIIKNGRAVENFADLNGSRVKVEELCSFFWAGRMEDIITFAGLAISPEAIYEKLEGKIWPNLILKRPME